MDIQRHTQREDHLILYIFDLIPASVELASFGFLFFWVPAFSASLLNVEVLQWFISASDLLTLRDGSVGCAAEQICRTGREHTNMRVLVPVDIGCGLHADTSQGWQL
jgi:hypothetical protein